MSLGPGAFAESVLGRLRRAPRILALAGLKAGLAAAGEALAAVLVGDVVRQWPLSSLLGPLVLLALVGAITVALGAVLELAMTRLALGSEWAGHREPFASTYRARPLRELAGSAIAVRLVVASAIGVALLLPGPGAWGVARAVIAGRSSPAENALALAIAVGPALLGLTLALALALAFTLALPVVAAEGGGSLAALRRSPMLMRGSYRFGLVAWLALIGAGWVVWALVFAALPSPSFELLGFEAVRAMVPALVRLEVEAVAIGELLLVPVRAARAAAWAELYLRALTLHAPGGVPRAQG
jgi:hypothetical protein